MANKKFYYHGKKNTSTTNKPAGAAQRADSRYPVEKTSVTLEALGVSPSLAELLGKNRISTAGDLVRRTEKDMFRVQGFNKKMLFELRDLLKARGMEFNPDPAAQPVQQKAQQKPAKQPERNGARSAAEEAAACLRISFPSASLKKSDFPIKSFNSDFVSFSSGQSAE